MKFCKDCKWCEPDEKQLQPREQLEFARCDNPKNLIYTVDLITGKDIMKRKQEFCSVQRIQDWLDCRLLGRCGKEGRWYERSNV